MSINDRPDYRSEAYEEYCKDYPFHYYSPMRPVGSWVRPGVPHALVASENGRGYIYTSAPIAAAYIESIELVPANSAAIAAAEVQS